jgi:protein-histidine pros-kinase
MEFIESELGSPATFVPPVMVTPLQSDDEHASGFLVTSGDFSEDEQAQHEVERGHTEETFRRLLASARGAMVIVDVDGKIVLANAQTESLFGYTPEELTGRGVDTLMPARYHDVHPGHRDGFFRDPRARPMGTGLDLWAIRKDGTELPVEISISPIETEDGVLAAAEIRDVTERRRFEVELQETNTQLAAASQAKDRFLASMSHELRTPLNAVIGFTGTILMGLSGPLTADQRKQLETVKTNGKQLLAIINDLLDLAQIESGKVELTFEPVDCRALLEEVVSGLRPVADAKGIDLQVVIAEHTVTLQTDRRALSQILINLTNNAIKYTDEGSVRVELDECETDDGSMIRFTVVDTGLGIKEEDRVRLFTAFQQVEPSATRRTEGTGLGLYISQKLAELIHGTLGFESEYGAGSRFVLELPMTG